MNSLTALALAQQWVIGSGQTADRVWIFSVLGILGNLLHALVYVLLLIAVLADRPENSTPQ